MNQESEIEFVITGGTIDSVYDGTKDTVVPSNESILPEVMRLIKSDAVFYFNTVCMKDSRGLNAEDLENIFKAIVNSKCSKIIVTHGTYTMPDTARYLQKKLIENDKTVILTGSLVPIKGFSPSDGPFNLGYAVAKVRELPPGVYVAMNARIFTPDEVVKRISEGKFVSILGEK
ncbi:MAG TPA: asparaginase domain-containing protein [Candidatus Paceibacterota bacterium]|nr:asparaginase domain-containing protein [Candidatus Paceibacterota bacterium]